MTYSEYGATGGYRHNWGAGTGPTDDISGRRSSTNPPPGGDGGTSNLPNSMQQLSGVLESLMGVIQNQAAQTQQFNTNFSMMTGKNLQTGAMSGFSGIGGMGFSIPHSAGRGSVPKVEAVFPAPGGGRYTQEVENLRGRSGALPNVGTVSGLRARAARAISESETGFGPRLVSVKDPTGKIVTHRLTGESNADGTPKSVAIDPNDEARLRTWERMGSAAQGALGKAVAGNGLGGIGDIAGAILPEAVAGPVGLTIAGVAAVGAVGMESARMVANQRAQNAQYQSVMGGTNLQGMGQRISEARFGLRNMFGMGQGQAQEAFMGATQQGMRGTERNNALNMAVSSFNTMGMSVAQSLQAMSVQAQSGYENFNSLEQSLKNVTAAAKDTSQNADEMRQNFISLYGSMTSQIGGGAGVQGAATGISTMQTNLGRQFANVDFSGMTDQQRQYQMAAEQGMSINAFTQKSITDPGFLAGAINKNVNQFMNAAGGGSAVQAINSALSSGRYTAGPNGLSPAQVSGLTSQVLTQLPPIPQLRSILQSAIGVDTTNMSNQAVAEFYVNWQAGQTKVSAPTTAGPQNISAAQRAALAQSTDPRNAATYKGDIEAVGAAAKGSGVAGGTTIDVGTIAGGGSHQQLRLNYLRSVGTSGAKGGQNSTIIDSMLKDNTSWKKLYTVQTSQGAKTVNFNDLMTHYSDQLASGGVSYASGTDAQGNNLAGLSVASQHGGPTDEQAYAAANKATSAGQKLQGKDQTAALKKADAKAKEKQVLTISATPQLQQLLSFAMNGQSVSTTTATSLTPTLGALNSESMAGNSPSNYSGI
jgi:hypothetical protein